MDARLLWRYEANKLFPDEGFIVQFCELTGCTADWIYLGRMTNSMPAVLAAGIGAIEPELVSHRVPAS